MVERERAWADVFVERGNGGEGGGVLLCDAVKEWRGLQSVLTAGFYKYMSQSWTEM